MANIIPYMNFNGNCREAMKYYQNILGGELILQTVGESPDSDKMPPKMQEMVMHAALTNGSIEIYASDMLGLSGLSKGNSLALLLNCDTEEQVRTIFKALSDDGTVEYPLEISFWGALFGNLIDKYGYHWLLSYQINSNN